MCLPPGCAIHLQREAQQAVLDNIKQTLGAGWNALDFVTWSRRHPMPAEGFEEMKVEAG